MTSACPGSNPSRPGPYSVDARGGTGIVAGEGNTQINNYAYSMAPPLRPALRQLPADTALFTGRDGELDRLLALARQSGAGDSPGTVVISAIGGMGGIGKTALAVRAAHRLAARFPDGQLFIDLHGFTQGTVPRDPGDALAVLLSSLGVPPGQMPADLDARAALYRDRLAGTRTLIVLDNAADEAQVRPLLPASDTCLVLVTSRRRLKTLDDALPLPLDVLPPDEAAALLRKAGRLSDHPPDEPLLKQAAELCGRLPIALLISGALLRTGGNAWDLTVLTGRLAAREPGRELAGYTDDTRSLEAVFDLSYRNLPEDQRLLFRRLGLLPGPEIDAYAAAALLDTGAEQASRLLQRLSSHSLLTGASPGRYRLHDLIRAHARTMSVALDPESEREASQSRLLHYYAHTAQAASLPIARLPRAAPAGPPPASAPGLAGPETARTWLRTEYPNLEAAHAHASAHALDGHAIALAAGLAEILQTDGPWARAMEIHQAAADAAERRQQPAAYATALTDLGRMRYRTGDYAEAAGAHERALEIYRQAGDRRGEANALTNLGQVRYMAEAWPGAGDAITQALEIFRELGNRLGEANALNDLGHVRHLAGDFPAAAHAHARALEISRQIGHRIGEANALNHMGRLRQRTGDYPEAAGALAQALQIYRQLGDRRGEAGALNYLGRVHHATGDFRRAEEAFARALEIYLQIGDRIGEAGVLNYLGQVRLATGDLPWAADAQARALEIFRRIGDRTDEAWTLNHYAATIAATGERPRAFALYRQALAMTREMNMPSGEALSLEGIAEHHLAAADRTQGTENLRQALLIYQRLGMRPDAERVAARLAAQ
jgi:tetratricopeptide (TPR) repeat protein